MHWTEGALGQLIGLLAGRLPLGWLVKGLRHLQPKRHKLALRGSKSSLEDSLTLRRRAGASTNHDSRPRSHLLLTFRAY